MRKDLPRGTVTFLFTDIDGSTRLLHEYGDQYAELLAAHRVVVRAALSRHAGVEVDTQGDAFFAAFSGAGAAAAAATEIRDGLGDGPVRVRIGIHTGEPLLTDEGYVGLEVHRAARIGAAAHGGQVVLSRATRDLLGTSQAVLDLGEHRLKDLTDAERIFQLGGGEFPPLRTLDASNLPVATSPLLGRNQEVAELLALLRGQRLITVSGPGGTGKTRLALQVAAERVGALADGVFWVGLGSLTDPDLVPSEIAHAIGARDDLRGFLRGRTMLILLDNFEHLLPAAKHVADLLAQAPNLQVLVTSRAPLHLSGEVEYKLDPLAATDAVALFVERARAAGRQVEPDATAGKICARLDGLPLAIELAAARTRLLAPAALLARLEKALAVLTQGSRDAPERQRTLRATIEWSHGLLNAESQQLLARLAVFSGSFPIEAAESAFGAEVDDLSALVDLNLLKPLGDGRLLMLETIREFALERLALSGEEASVRQRHAETFVRLAELAYEGREREEATWSARLNLDHDDLRSALDWLGEVDLDAALGLAGALGWFWFTRGYLVEGDERLRMALGPSAVEGHIRARALTAAGSLAARVGRVDEGRDRLEQAVARWSELGNRRETASTLEAQGWLLFYDAGDDAAALAAFEQARSIHEALGDPAGETGALVGACQVLVSLDAARAEPMAHQLLARARSDLRTTHFALHFLADCALIRGDCVGAEARYRESLLAALELGDVIEKSCEVQGIAMARAGQGAWALALELAGSVEALWRSLGTDLHVAFWDRLLERYLGPARDALGAQADAARQRGLALPFDEAVAIALREEENNSR
jgi:predicted ATPase/class 3 adenylate cyclase